MQRFSGRFKSAFPLVSLLILLVNPVTPECQQQDQARDNEAYAVYRTTREIEDPSERLKAIEQFLKDYPQAFARVSALRDAIYASAEIDSSSTLVIEYAERYIELYSSRGQLASAYLIVARTLHRAKSWPDKAKEYCDMARAGLEENRNPIAKANDLLIIARVEDWIGNTEEAIRLQREVIELSPTDYEEVAVLGAYLLRAGRSEEAEGYLVKGLLRFPYHEDAIEALNKLCSQKAPPGVDTDEFRESLFRETAESMLTELDDPLLLKQQFAVSFGELGILSDLAVIYAEDVVQEAEPAMGPTRYAQAHIDAAWAFSLQEENEKVLETLEPVSRLASSSLLYHSLRGEALANLGRKEEALEAYLENARLYPYPTIRPTLRALCEEVHGTERDLEGALEILRKELEDWHITEPYEVPPDWSGQVVLAELFTGAECGPCVAADLAFDGLIEYYPRTTAAVLVYHVHIPGPDPMTNPDTEARMAYYTRDVVRGTPTSIINGVYHTVGGGGESGAERRFNEYSWTIERELATVPQADIDLSGTIRGDEISFRAKVRLEEPGLHENDRMRVRVALAEELLHYSGGNGIEEHRMVVRTFIGGHEGFPLRQGEKTTLIRASLNMTDIERDLLAYLDEWESQNQERFRGDPGFSRKMNEIDEGKLLLVAFLQDDSTKRILQTRVLELK